MVSGTEWNTLSKQEKSTLLKSAGLPIGLSQLSWSGLQKSERAKIEKVYKGKEEQKGKGKYIPVRLPTKEEAERMQREWTRPLELKPRKSKGKGWREAQEDVRTEKGIEKKAPIHREVAIKKEASEANNKPMEKKERPEEKPAESVEPAKAPWQMMRDEFIERYYQSDKNNRTIWKGKDFTEATAKIEANKLGFGWSIEPSPYEKGRWIVVTKKDKTPFMDYKLEYGYGLIIVHKQMIKKALAEGKPVPPEVLREYELSEEPAQKEPAHEDKFAPTTESMPEKELTHEEVLSKNYPLNVSDLSVGDRIRHEHDQSEYIIIEITADEVLIKDAVLTISKIKYIPIKNKTIGGYTFVEKAMVKDDPAVYESLITKLNEAKTLKEVGDINQEATKAEISGKITFEQLQKIYSLVHEKDESLSRMNEMLVDTFKMKIDRAEDKESLWALVREINTSSLSAAYKTQLENLIKKKVSSIIEEEDRKASDMTLVNEFKTKIEQATDVNQLAELSFQITDNVANGNFTRAKVVTSDIHLLHELIDDKMSRLYKERIGTTEEFSKKVPMNLIVISTEVNRLKDLNKKIQASYLNQSRKDNLDILINSIIGGIRALTPKQNVESLDALSNIKESDAYKMLLIKISEFTTLTQLNTFSVEFNRQMQAMGIESVEDPRISDIIKLMSAKRKQLTGTQETKIIRTPEKYEIENLKYEAEHVPSKMLPPKEIEDVTKYSWGLSEPEAVKKYVDRERKKLQSNIDYTNKQKAELDAIAKDKPWVLLTRAEIQKRYPPEEAEQKSRDLWTYKTKKSDWEKNADSARFWQSKVDKIDSGEWQTINTNYLREQYQKEVKEAIKHGKPVPFDVIKQYPEFTKAQDNRERYEKGRHTSFANVSIAVDTKHQENTGVKIKRQDGKALDEKTADDVVKAISQYQSVVGDITPIMKREDLTIAHTGKKHPFLSTAAGIYHGTDVTISLGKGTGAHELLHFIDETAKRRHKDQPLYDYNLIAFAKKNMNGGVYAIERALSLNKYKSPEELEQARNLRYMLGSYWQRVEEVMARLVEQYTAYKDKGIQGTDLLHHPYELYIRTPAYWDDVTFTGMLPQIEAELQRKIKLARE